MSADTTNELFARAEALLSWDELRDKAMTCPKCRLAEGRTNVVFGVGDPDADLMFVGEGPGRDEDLQAEPFVGRAGRLLTRLIEDLGMTRDDVYIANVVKCRPPNNRDPKTDEMDACHEYLEGQFAHIRPRVVMTLGNVATKRLLGTKQGITKIRGREFPFLGGAAVLVPTFHPAAVLRGRGEALAQMRADFVVAKRALARSG